MPRITIKMLQEKIQDLERLLEISQHTIDLLQTELKVMKSPYSPIGQIASMIIANERIGDALAHTLAEVKKRPPF